MSYESTVTVVTAAASRDLCTLSAAANQCGAAVSEISDLGLLVAAASSAIELITRRRWIQEGVRQTFRGNGQSVMRLLLARAPVTTLASVTVDGVALNLSTEVECDMERGIAHRLDLDCRAPWSGRVVVVEYTGGYTHPGVANATLPATVQLVAAKIVAGWYHGQGRDPRLRSQTIEDVGSKSFVDPTPEDLGLPPGIGPILMALRWSQPG